MCGVQIPCRGRGQAPQPDAVNEFCWTITAFNQHCQQEGKALWTIVHCTHGFNRTGNMSNVGQLYLFPANLCLSLVILFQAERHTQSSD